MNKKLLNKIPKKFLCPYCGEWHDFPKPTFPFRFYNSKRPLRLGCPYYQDLFDIEQYIDGKSYRNLMLSRPLSSEYYTPFTTRKLVEEEIYKKIKKEGNIAKVNNQYKQVGLNFFFTNESIHFQTDRRCRDAREPISSLQTEFSDKNTKNLGAIIPLSSIENRDDKIVIFTVSIPSNFAQPIGYGCKCCKYRDKCLFFKTLCLNIKLGFEFF